MVKYIKKRKRNRGKGKEKGKKPLKSSVVVCLCMMLLLSSLLLFRFLICLGSVFEVSHLIVAEHCLDPYCRNAGLHSDAQLESSLSRLEV